MRKMKKLADGGRAARGQSRYDRMVKDIESDFEKAKGRKSGRALEVARAKYEQRMADAKDDLAKARGEDRSATRAAEKAAESNLTMTRRYGASTSSAKVRDAEPIAKTMSPSEIASKVSAADTSPARRAPARSAPARSAPARSAPARSAERREASPRPASRVGSVKIAPRMLSRDEAVDLRALYRPASARTSASPAADGRRTAAPATSERKQDPDWGRKVLSRAEAERSSKRRFLPDGKLNPAAVRPDGSIDMSYQAKGGTVKKYAKGGKIDGCAVRGKTRAK